MVFRLPQMKFSRKISTVLKERERQTDGERYYRDLLAYNFMAEDKFILSENELVKLRDGKNEA